MKPMRYCPAVRRPARSRSSACAQELLAASRRRSSSRSRRSTRTCWRSPKKTAASCGCSWPRRGPKRALEIGTASGYSAIWIGLGLRETGGQLVTIEYDKRARQEAMANIKKAGLSDIVHVISGDALVEIPKLSGAFDFVFCDAWKRDYQKYFSMSFRC